MTVFERYASGWLKLILCCRQCTLLLMTDRTRNSFRICGGMFTNVDDGNLSLMIKSLLALDRKRCNDFRAAFGNE